MDISSSNTVDIMENQILKTINHIKYISKKKPSVKIFTVMLQIMITILLNIN